MKYFIAIFFIVCLSVPTYSQQYWKVGSNTTQVWSLDNDDFVSITDTDYTNWLAQPGNETTKIGSNTELYSVISQSFPAHLSDSAPNLDAAGGLTPFQAFSWRRAEGLNITYTGYPGLSGQYPIDDQWLGGLMTGALLRCSTTPLDSCNIAFPFGLSSYTYLDKDFVPHTFAVVQLRTVVLAIQDYFAALYSQLQIGLGGGTPSWPSSSVTIP